jgi:hypothetical protein
MNIDNSKNISINTKAAIGFLLSLTTTCLCFMAKSRTRILFSLALCVTALVSGCATPVARNVQTASGKPEVTIARTDVSAVKSHFLNLSINDGYSLEKDSEFTLELSRSLEGMENLAATMVAGNGYTTNTRVVNYTFAKVSDGVRVIVSNSVRAVFPTGRVNTVQINEQNTLANSYQAMLEKGKKDLETKNPQIEE